MKSDRGRRGRRPFPYRTRFISPVGTPAPATITQQAHQSQQQQRRLGFCFSCGESRHWKFQCPNVKHKFVKLSIENSFSCLDQIDISDIKHLEGCEAGCYNRNGRTEQSEDTLDNSKDRVDLQRVSSDKSSVSPYNRLKNVKINGNRPGQTRILRLL